MIFRVNNKGVKYYRGGMIIRKIDVKFDMELFYYCSEKSECFDFLFIMMII